MCGQWVPHKKPLVIRRVTLLGKQYSTSFAWQYGQGNFPTKKNLKSLWISNCLWKHLYVLFPITINAIYHLNCSILKVDEVKLQTLIELEIGINDKMKEEQDKMQLGKFTIQKKCMMQSLQRVSHKFGH